MQSDSMLRWVRVLIFLGLLVLPANAAEQNVQPNLSDWPAIERAAKGQTVYWNAWAGEASINSYIEWAAAEVEKRFGVMVEHVKLSDTAEAVSKVVAEKAAGRDNGGSVDLIWINGPNFASMKEKNLLYGPWAEQLPNYRLVDIDNPAVRSDFTIATEGYEAPWDEARLVFYYDGMRLKNPPRSAGAILDFARSHPGRFTYPDVQNFLGATFLKQVLIELAADRSVLQRAPSDVEFERTTAPLWSYLDMLHQFLWRRGKAFPANSAELRQLFADREIDIGFSFNPSEASLAIARKELPNTVRAYVLDGGTIGNASFLAIPFNAAHKEGAIVLANFLLTPQAQARKQNPRVWGGTTVLAVERLNDKDRRWFEEMKSGEGALGLAELGKTLPEPHPGWMTRITARWLERYVSQ
jgi:putative thiamine transport system substrate-binding protein